MKQAIVYTKTDEAPALATCSLVPIIRTFLAMAGVDVEIRDISLAARILAAFPCFIDTSRRVTDDLACLAEMVQHPEANIIKLPNISASVPQLVSAVSELRAQGYAIPEYPAEPETEEEMNIRKIYDRIKGSAVNPVLREGNSDRRVPKAVKNHVRKHPHSMGAWSVESRSHVSSMGSGDFYGSEKSVEITEPLDVKIEFENSDGEKTILKRDIALETGEIVDAAVMSQKALDEFFLDQLEDARDKGVLFSIHLKATMMKVSDPVIFGRAVYAYFKPVFDKHKDYLTKSGVKLENGLSGLLTGLEKSTDGKSEAVKGDIQRCLDRGPQLAMVDSDRGITNLHVPSDVIIDASMPAAIRSSGRMWDADGTLKDMKAVIPDRTYAGVYSETIRFCKEHGALDPATLGSVSNIGLMAQKAEEYGSHDTTFIAPGTGRIRVVDSGGREVLAQPVEKGDIFRMCRVKDRPVKAWVSLAVERAQETGLPAVFWLDENRAHDIRLIEKVRRNLQNCRTDSLDIRIMSPAEATRFTLERMTEGKDTISVTGNVLRDYLTDLFPILELGTSAKMLSIVPLMNGGRLFETGAGGSAPKHVRQFLDEGHLRWDSLGEFLALAVSLEHLALTTGNKEARLLAETLHRGTEELLENGKSPSRKTGELDTRGSHFYLALYWARALADQTEDEELKAFFKPLAEELSVMEKIIIAELHCLQGETTDIGGYYHPDPVLLENAMRPSKTFNRILELFPGSK